MTYSCNPNHPNQQWSADTSKNRKCRFSGRYDPLHQQSGCSGCPRETDHVYLDANGLSASKPIQKVD